MEASRDADVRPRPARAHRYWAALTDLLPSESLSLGAGLLGGALNLLPSFLPTVLAVAAPDRALLAIAACGLAGAALIGRCAAVVE